MIARLCSVVMLLLCCCSPDPESANMSGGGDGSVGSSVLVSIAELRGRYVGSTHMLVDMLCVEGVITANNIYGEFPNLLIIEDDSGAIELRVEFEDDELLYQIGCEVVVDCTGLWIGSSGGVLTLGEEPTEDYVVDQISESDLEWRFDFTGDVISYAPQVVTIAELTQSMCSCYIVLEEVIFENLEGATSLCERDPDTGRLTYATHILVDRSGDRIELYIPSTATYADESIPTGWGSVCGVVGYFAGEYSIQIVGARYRFDES